MSEADLSQEPIYSARPTIRVNGQADEKVSSLMTTLTMTEQDGGMSALDLRLSNFASDPEGDADYAFEDEQVLKLGATIEVYAGDADGPRAIFKGVITGLEIDYPDAAPPEIVVLAEDNLQRARMSRRTALHADATIAGLANDLASMLSLTPVVTGFTDNIGTQLQLDESDLAFLRRLLALHDGDLQVVGSELHVSHRKDVQRGTLTLELYSQLRHARFSVDLAHQVTEVTLAGWNPGQGQRVTGTSNGTNLGPGSGRLGATILQDAVGERSEHVGHLAVATDDEARAVADAAFDRRARRFVTVCGTAEGNPSLRVGTHLTLHGLSRRLNNTYYVAKACHRFDLSHGYETDFEAECAYLGNP